MAGKEGQATDRARLISCNNNSTTPVMIYNEINSIQFDCQHKQYKMCFLPEIWLLFLPKLSWNPLRSSLGMLKIECSNLKPNYLIQ